jgi:phosphate transport system substrate-binding protein
VPDHASTALGARLQPYRLRATDNAFGHGMNKDQANENSAHLTTVLLAALLLCGSGLVWLSNGHSGLSGLSSRQSLQMAGSETMRPLMTACAEAFMADRPHVDVVVRGGGTGEGIAAALGGMVDLGMASRQLEPSKTEFAKSKSFELQVTPIALDGVAVIVHKDNQMRALELQQIRAIFSGEVQNWQAVGGADADIVRLVRHAGSGTAAFFNHHLGDPRPGASLEFATNDAIVNEISRNPNAIGYASLDSIRLAKDRMRVAGIRVAPEGSIILPNEATLRSGTYPLTRQLAFVAAAPISSTASEFITFCTGPYGRGLIDRAGFMSSARSS